MVPPNVRDRSAVPVPIPIFLPPTNADWTEIVKSYHERYGSSAPAEGYPLMADVIFCFEPAWGYDPAAIFFFQQGMITTEQFGQPDHIIIALAHLTSVKGDHIIMDPVTDRRYMIADGALGYFTFMMGK